MPRREKREKVRLQKVIAMAGVASRRRAEDLMREGRVKVGGRVVTTPGTKVDPLHDVIEVDGKRITPGRGPRIYMMLNKPRGFISAASDPLGRPVVTDLLRGVRARLYPVGRLDWDAEGVIILTNDGELTHRLLHPSFSVPRKYLVKVKDVPSEKDLKRLEKGVFLPEGKTKPARVRLVRRTRENSWLEITVTEGRNRLIKRMCAAVGHPVLKLKRVSFAGLGLGRLRSGEARPLRESEVEKLKRLVGLA